MYIQSGWLKTLMLSPTIARFASPPTTPSAKAPRFFDISMPVDLASGRSAERSARATTRLATPSVTATTHVSTRQMAAMSVGLRVGVG